MRLLSFAALVAVLAGSVASDVPSPAGGWSLGVVAETGARGEILPCT